jgi:hypothetical protein
MRERWALIFLAILLLGMGSACATILTSDKQDVKIRAYPPDAQAVVDGKQSVDSNTTVPMTRDSQHFIDFTKDGFETRRVMVKQSINPYFFLNFALLPLFWVGMAVDAVTGRISDLEPTDITVNLNAKGAGSPAASLASNTKAPTSGGGGGVSLDVKSGGPTADPFDVSPKGGPVKSTASQKSSSQPAGPAVEDPVTAKPAGPSAVSSGRAGADRPHVARTMVSGPQKEWVIAVMNAGATGKNTFDKGTLLALTDQIRVFLAERGARVVDRSQQEAALRDLVNEEKKRSYSSCVDSSCQVPLGKALAASHILKSNVAKFGKTCATNGELIDLKSEVTVQAGSAKTECSEEALLYAAESLAEQLISGSAKK